MTPWKTLILTGTLLVCAVSSYGRTWTFTRGTVIEDGSHFAFFVTPTSPGPVSQGGIGVKVRLRDKLVVFGVNSESQGEWLFFQESNAPQCAALAGVLDKYRKWLKTRDVERDLELKDAATWQGPNGKFRITFHEQYISFVNDTTAAGSAAKIVMVKFPEALEYLVSNLASVRALYAQALTAEKEALKKQKELEESNRIATLAAPGTRSDNLTQGSEKVSYWKRRLEASNRELHRIYQTAMNANPDDTGRGQYKGGLQTEQNEWLSFRKKEWTLVADMAKASKAENPEGLAMYWATALTDKRSNEIWAEFVPAAPRPHFQPPPEPVNLSRFEREQQAREIGVQELERRGNAPPEGSEGLRPMPYLTGCLNLPLSVWTHLFGKEREAVEGNRWSFGAGSYSFKADNYDIDADVVDGVVGRIRIVAPFGNPSSRGAANHLSEIFGGAETGPEWTRTDINKVTTWVRASDKTEVYFETERGSLTIVSAPFVSKARASEQAKANMKLAADAARQQAQARYKLPLDCSKLTRREWREAAGTFFTTVIGRYLADANTAKFKEVFGSPSYTASEQGRTVWLFYCSDGPILLDMKSDPEFTGRLIMAEINDYAPPR